MTWNQALDTGGLMISEVVDIIMEVELIKTENDKATQMRQRGASS